jgi:site-specific DNA recombinase
MRTAIYLRISQDKTGEAAGVTRQQEDCIALADQLSWQVVEVYQDNDTSATSGKPRPAYRRMLADIEADRIDAIVTWHTDRLYRTMRDLEELVDMVEGHKLAIRTVRAGDIDLATPTGRMLARILGATAQHEVEQKADRWLRSVRQRREAGRFSGAGPRTFGREQDGTIRVDEAEALRDLAPKILSGAVTVRAACKQLDAVGFTTSRGNPWAPDSLRQTLVNPRIAGLSVLNGVILGEGQFEAILDVETWTRLTAYFTARSTGVGGTNARSLLAGLAVCGFIVGEEMCGRALTRGYTSRSIYQCRTAAMSNRHVTISAEPLEEMVEAAAKAHLLSPDLRARIEARLAPGNVVELQREIVGLEAELDEWRDSLQATTRAATKLDIVRAMDKLHDEIDDRRARIGSTLTEPLPVSEDEWPEEVGRRARLIQLAVGRVVVHPVVKRTRGFNPGRVTIEPAQP